MTINIIGLNDNKTGLQPVERTCRANSWVLSAGLKRKLKRHIYY